MTESFWFYSQNDLSVESWTFLQTFHGRYKIERLNIEEIENMSRFYNRVGGLITRKNLSVNKVHFNRNVLAENCSATQRTAENA